MQLGTAAGDGVQVAVHVVVGGKARAVFSPTVHAGRIVEINILADPDRLANLDLPPLH